MTVEQTAQPVYNQKAQSENDDYAKIKEVTNIDDYERINEAIKACRNDTGNYDISDVISKLIAEEPASGPSATASTSTPPVTMVSQGVGTEGASAESGSDSPQTFIGPKNKPGTEVIDLTHDKENEEIQRAIAESLRDNPGILGGQVSREDQDISRVLEQSLLEESKVGTKRKRGDIWFVDPLNPHERKRRENWPVGLKNVGNTCWFSAVIQSLFHLPIFRRLVLDFVPPPDISKGNVTKKRNLLFMHELRKLFALMIGSKRKYVDPSKAVEILKEAFTSGTGLTDSQQDVSEFQHKLLEWLEDAYRSDQSRPASPAPGVEASTSKEHPSNNPMVQLFYGQYTAEGINEGKNFTNKETFGQFPMQVDGFRDVHESLEAATAAAEIETVSGDNSLKSGQEQWFTRLPPVLTFELSRFQFNQALGRPEKIHNKLEFPEKLFMDRYMDCNKSITRLKREEVKKLKDELLCLQAQLDKFVNYGSGPKRVPLQDVLHYALEFAQTKSPTSTTTSTSPGEATPTGRRSITHDVEMESPKSQSSMSIDSPAKPEGAASQSDVAMSPASQTSPPQCTPMTNPSPPAPHSIIPSPKHVSNDELRVLQTCLKRWRTEVESDVMDLQGRIGQRENAVGIMYTEPGLQKFPYQLHAVLVHEGQAASGHYWAYVFSSRENTWLKFNDITVTEAQWEELHKESVGGYHNASAYCLMYIDATKSDIIQEPDSAEAGKGPMSMDHLPNDLQEYVREDNERFEKEIEEWDVELKRKASKSESESQTPTHGKGSQASGQTLVLKTPSVVEKHAQLYSMATYKLVMDAVESDKFVLDGAKNSLLHVCQQELKRVDSLVSSLVKHLPHDDHRLSHIVVYLRANQANLEKHIKRLMLQQFECLTNLNSEDKCRKIRQVAITELDIMRETADEQDNKIYLQWHEDFSLFRNSAMAFIKGVEFYNAEKYADALPYLRHACDTNHSLVGENEEHPMKGFSIKLLQNYRRECLLQINKVAVNQFCCDDNVDDALDLMNKLVVPCLTVLSNSTIDQQAIETIRNEWCKILGEDWPGHKMEKLQDLLQKLLDPPVEVKQLFNVTIMRTLEETYNNNLFEQFQNALKTAKQHGLL